MAHPKSKISKQRKRKRRTHFKAVAPNVHTCPQTGEAHLRHRAYYHEGDLYYKGQIVVKQTQDLEDEG